MAKVREDLIGSVLVNGALLVAGDEVPDGARIEESFLATARKVGTASVKVSPSAEPSEAPKPKRGRPKKVEAEDAEAVD